MAYTSEKANITATITIWNGEEYQNISRDFEVELRPFGKIYNPELISWVLNESRRVSNMMTVEYNGKKHTYSI